MKWVLATAAALVVASAVAVFLVRGGSDDDSREPAAFDPAAAQEAAARACRSFGRFEQLVEDNASGKEVFKVLDQAKEEADRAADLSPRWRSLASGVDALRVGVKDDLAGAARTGVDIVRHQCTLTR